MSSAAGIYIHVPFCASRCHYCNFATGGYESELAARYVAALQAEISRAAQTVRPDALERMRGVDTVYFGGGTPTTLSVEQLGRVVALCRETFDVAADAEITAEANPGSVSLDYLRGLRAVGFNRLSFGVQSFDDGE
jgi:oxygen-independent coproporphyrinogen III oxidase